MNINGQWVGWGLGDNSSRDFTVRDAKAYMRRAYKSYAGSLADTNIYDQEMQDTVIEMQNRLVTSGALTSGQFLPGILDLPTEYAMGFRKRPDPTKPIIFSVEGHMSNMFAGPSADTATVLEKEGLVHHQPIGYDNGALPFNNNSGVQGLAQLVAGQVMPNDVPFAEDCDWYITGFSQGMIVVFDFCDKYLKDGQPLAHRRKYLKGILANGNPNRAEGSVAPWAIPWVKNPDTHGLDPYKRFKLPGCFNPDDYGIPMVDVWREGDIFAQNGDDDASQAKAAVYEAAARGDLFSNPTSIVAQIASVFSRPFEEIWGIFMAIVSGIGFLATGPNNPHYSPYDISGGINWMRGLIQNG